MAAKKKDIDVKTIGAKYLKNTDLTVKDLAKEAGCHPHTLKRALVAAGFEIRHYYPNGKGDAKKSAEKKTTAKVKAPAAKKATKAKVAKAVKSIKSSGSGRRGFINR